jgi:hypothetical protein
MIQLQHHKINCALVVFSILFTRPASAGAISPQSSTVRPITWSAPTKYIAGTRRSRKRILTELNAINGRWVVAYLSIQCGDCDRVARLLNQYVRYERVLGVAQGQAEEVHRWASGLHLAFQIRCVSGEAMEDLGAVILPTIVLYVNGIARGSRAPSMEAGWR